VKGAIRTRGQKEEKGLGLREERDCAPRGAHFSFGKRDARAASEKSRERRRRNQSCDKGSDIETPKDEGSEHCDDA
jgi:hypothetical protein